jgi:hypothetical protein
LDAAQVRVDYCVDYRVDYRMVNDQARVMAVLLTVPTNNTS